MLWLAVCFATGIGAAAYMPFGPEVLVGLCALSAAASFFLRTHWFSTVLIFIAFALSGSLIQLGAQASDRPDRLGRMYDDGRISSVEPVEFVGKVVGSVESASEGILVLVEVDSVFVGDQQTKASGRVRVFAPMPTPEIAAFYHDISTRRGTRVRVLCELKRDYEFRNPGGLSRRKILEWQGLDATCSLNGPLAVESLGQTERNDFVDSIYDARDGLITKFRELFNPQVAGVMIASLLGNKHFLDASTADIFREGGTFHILVISGLHITFIGGLAAWFVGLFTRRKAVQFVIVCTFLWLYTFTVGAEIPVVRASLMFTVLWFSYVIHRSGSLANALGVCGLILLAWRPNDLFSPSFQLTFVSVAAIVMVGFPLIKMLQSIGRWVPSTTTPFPARVPAWLSRLCETLYWNEKEWEIESARNVWSANLFKLPLRRTGFGVVQRTTAYLFEGILISAIVQIAMLPLVVHYFHRVTPASIPLNIWTGVLIALESFSSLTAVTFSYVSASLALPFVWLTEIIHWLMVSVPGQFADFGWLSFRVPVYPGTEAWIYAVFYGTIIPLGLTVFIWNPFIVTSGSSRVRSGTISAIAFLAFVTGFVIILHPFSSPRPDGRLHVEFLDVGQGDSIFITFPNGETMLVDAGGRRRYDDEGREFEPDFPSIGEAVVSEFLWERGYSKIDFIVPTHADADHIQGLGDVARNFRIGEAWFAKVSGTDPDETRLIAELNRQGTPRRTVSRGERFEIGGASVEILSPGDDAWITTKENDRSVVMRIVLGQRSFLLTGDAEKEAEAGLTSGTSNLHSDVIKVPHHGSKTSSTAAFVDAVHPRFAVIPVGRRSTFGHPHKEVVDRWQAVGSSVLTTGQQGMISFSTDGKDLVFTTFDRNAEQ